VNQETQFKTEQQHSEIVETRNTFSSAADVRILPDGVRVLLTPIRWAEVYDDPASRTLTAKAGMIHDGASIPILFSFLNGASVQLAAILHDAAYRTHAWDNGDPMSRWHADLLMFRAASVAQRRARTSFGSGRRLVLIVSHFVQRSLILAGLRTPFGRIAWNKSAGRDDKDTETLRQISAILKALEIAEAVVPGGTR
jgi:hypothetical protein